MNGSSRALSSARLVGGMVSAHICSLLGSAAYASALVELARLWGLNSTRAGSISSAYFVGYTVGVPLLVALTDRLDARVIYLVGCGVGAVAGACFAGLASGFWSALCLQAMAGLAIGGTYMPGLRLLTSRLAFHTRIRVVPYYTTSFPVGTSVSLMLSGWIAVRYGWRATFLMGGFGSLAAAALALIATWGYPVQPDLNVVSTRHAFDFRPVLRNRAALIYVLAYAGHCWELFAFRSWLPTYLLYVWTLLNSSAPKLWVSRWSMLIVLAGVPASILGAELANPENRNRLIRRVQFASVGVSLLSVIFVNFSLALAVVALFVYHVAAAADSGALTAGLIATAKPAEQGVTLAIYSFFGFAGASIGPLVVGRVLDFAGGFNGAHAWYLGFAAMAVGSVLAATAMSLVRFGLACSAESARN